MKSAFTPALSREREREKWHRKFVCSVAWGAAMAALGAASTDVSAQPANAGDAGRGKALYQGCAACHSLEENEIGPSHRGVFGRRAGAVADYNYSPALRRSGLVWDAATLDAWLANPSALVPGTKMFFKVDEAKARADLIAYLKEQK